MRRIIDGLLILAKYTDEAPDLEYEHIVVHVAPSAVTAEDLAALERLGFVPSDEYSPPQGFEVRG